MIRWSQYPIYRCVSETVAADTADAERPSRADSLHSEAFTFATLQRKLVGRNAANWVTFSSCRSPKVCRLRLYRRRIAVSNDSLNIELSFTSFWRILRRKKIRQLCGNLTCVSVQYKRSFYRAANNIMGKIGRIVSEEVTLQLKCISILLYGLEACPLNKSQTQSLDFVINRLFIKLFNTSDITLVKQCQEQFNFTLPSVALERRRTKFMHKLCCVDFFT